MTTATQIKERPILFSGPMVRAIIDGRKTQTRRACKDQTPLAYRYAVNQPVCPDGRQKYTGWVKEIDRLSLLVPTACPFGQPGDRLWVREAWLPCYENAIENGVWYPADNKIVRMEHGDLKRSIANASRLLCRTSENTLKYLKEHGVKVSPSIHMPRWASRLTLEVVSVRVERVQDISEEDARAEGMNRSARSKMGYAYRDQFELTWNDLNAKRGYGWDVNPWVWAGTFKRIAETHSAPEADTY